MVALDRLRDGDIRICMFVDHPPPHIHAYQAEHELEVDIKTFSTKGRMPKTRAARVVSYVRENQQALLDAWDSLARGVTPSRLDR